RRWRGRPAPRANVRGVEIVRGIREKNASSREPSEGATVLGVMKNTIAKCTQREFGFTNWGGKRRGAGRKPKGRRAGVPHEKREAFRSSKALLVTQKLRLDVPSLRHPQAHAVVSEAL